MEPSNDQATDGALLAAFVLRRDEAAFAQIERRHGASVLCACRRTLGRSHDAEDAAQAAFIALATKAASLTGQASVAAWLHHVAWCACIDLRRQALTRVKYEREAMPSSTVITDDQDGDRARITAVFDEALESVPEKFRVPVILHHLQNHGHDEGAHLMGCKVGTFASRLSRGREMLRGALRQRGVALSLAMLTAFLSQQANARDLPPAVPLSDPTALSQLLASKTLPTVMHAAAAGSGTTSIAAWVALVGIVIAGAVGMVWFIGVDEAQHRSGSPVAVMSPVSVNVVPVQPTASVPVVLVAPTVAPTVTAPVAVAAQPAIQPAIQPIAQSADERPFIDKRRTIVVRDAEYIFAGLMEPTRMPMLHADQDFISIGTMDESILLINGKPEKFSALMAGERVFVRWKTTESGPQAIALLVERPDLDSPKPTAINDF
ncbi:MAG: RNA polymerase sigma factor [Planctomycetes bacterium]|nr:RNA polymerase sigma factor [Planctomycetota bacterium]